MTMNNYDRLVFFDTETTGLDPQRDQIIELAAVAVSSDMEPLDKIDALVRLPEGSQVPEFIRGLTGITDEELEKHGIPEDEAVRRFLQMLGIGKTLVVAYNAQFDLEFILEAMRRLGIAEDVLYKADFLDPLTVYRGRNAYGPHKLADAIKAYGVTGVNSHRASDDVEALMALYGAMQDEDVMESFINVFGYKKKYGLPDSRLEKVTYVEQV